MQGPQPNIQDNKLLTVKELGDRFSVSADWIYRRVRTNSADPLPVHRLGRALRFDPQELQEYLTCRSGQASDKVSPVSRPRERKNRMLSRRHFQTGGKPHLEGRKTKFWRGWYWQYFDDGTRKRKSVFIGYQWEFPTERTAKRKLNEIVGKMNDPEREPSSTVTLGGSYEEYAELAFPALKRSTQYDMKVMLSKHVLHSSLGSLPIDQLNRDVLQGHFNRLLRQGVSWGTVRKVRAYLSSVLSRALEGGRLRNNPVTLVKLPRRPAPKRIVLMDEADVVRIEAAIRNEKIRTLWWLTFQTGLRIGESSALRWCSIDWKNGVLIVRESVRNFQLGTPKTDSSTRILYLCEDQLERLREYRKLFPNAKEEDFLFPNKKGTGPVGYNNVMTRNIRPVAKKLGINMLGWHALRHLCSTIMDEERVPVGVRIDRLGHTTARTTLIYTHGRAAENRRASHLVFERFSRVQKSLESTTQRSPFGKFSSVLGTTLGTTPWEPPPQAVENRRLGP